MTEKHSRLASLLSQMDIPEGRRSLEALQEPQHLRWLSRNMFIRNSNHPSFHEADTLLRELLRQTK
mgnify:CR=1 FL=1|jgi:hypothetical protein